MNLSELTLTDLDVIRRNLEAKMEMINQTFLEYDRIEKAYIHFKQPLIFDFQKRKDSLRKNFDNISPVLNDVIIEIDKKISNKVDLDYSFQDQLMEDFKNIENFKKSIESLNNIKTLNT